MRFHVPTKIIFESGSLSQLKKIVSKEINASRPFLVTDQGMVKSGLAERVISQVPADIFDRVEQNPKSSTVNEAANIVRNANPDVIIGLGGGSSLDAAKAVALLALNPGSIQEYEGKQKYTHPPLPMVAIPTTCGTGSEVTWVAVITDDVRKFKMSIKGPHMFPEIAVIDPDVLKTLPQPLIASTGMDALTHAIEAYTVTPRTAITDMIALRAVQLLFASIEAAYTNIHDKPSRENIMLASTLAGMAFGNSDVGAVHCIAETIGGLYDVPHGVANSMFLPVVMEYNLPVVKNRYARLGRAVGIMSKDDDTAAFKFIQKVKELSQVLQIPPFVTLGIEKDDFTEIAQRSVLNNSNSSNPREMDVKDYIKILNAACENFDISS